MNGEAPLVAYFDGLCEPAFIGGPRNPGGMSCGGYAIEPQPDLPLFGRGGVGHAHFRSGEGSTNNVAEYEAALLCLRAIYQAGYRGPVVLRGDSQLVVRQFSGQYGCGAPLLIPLLAKLQAAATHFASVTLEWVPREQNEAADRQSRLAYECARRRPLAPTPTQMVAHAAAEMDSGHNLCSECGASAAYVRSDGSWLCNEHTPQGGQER